MKIGDMVQLLTPVSAVSGDCEPIEGMFGVVLGFNEYGRVHVGWGMPQVSPSAPGYIPAWPWGRLKVINESR